MARRAAWATATWRSAVARSRARTTATQCLVVARNRKSANVARTVERQALDVRRKKRQVRL